MTSRLNLIVTLRLPEPGVRLILVLHQFGQVDERPVLFHLLLNVITQVLTDWEKPWNLNSVLQCAEREVPLDQPLQAKHLDLLPCQLMVRHDAASLVLASLLPCATRLLAVCG